VAVLPIELPADLAARLARALDAEGKIAAALEALGPVRGRDVAFVDTPGGVVVETVRDLGARIVNLQLGARAGADLPDASFDVIVGLWSAFRGVDPPELAAAERLLRPGGRLLVLHDYGRDDVARLRGDRPEYGSWSRRSGPFLAGGFRVRVLHCWWTFETLDDARDFIITSFPEAGAEVAETLRRPRLSYNVAVYHRSTEGAELSAPPSVGATG